MTRRSFASLIAGGAAAAYGAETGPEHVIDVAVHFYDTARPQGVPWPPRNNTRLYKPSYPDRYLEAVKPYRVDGVVAIEASPWLEDNLWLLEVAVRNPLILGIQGHIEPGHPDFRPALDRFSKHPLFHGIRINGASIAAALQNPQALADLKMLMEKDLTLDILVGRPVFDQIARLSEALPDLRIVAGHLPIDKPEDAKAAFESGLAACGKRSRVYAKVSGVVRLVQGDVPEDGAFYKPGLDELWKVFGPDRVLYASNWPQCDMIAPYPVVWKIISQYVTSQGQDAVEKFFWRNSLTAYKLPAAQRH